MQILSIFPQKKSLGFIFRYRQKIDLADADEITLAEFLDDDEHFSEAKVDLYIKVWNKVNQ